MAGQQAAAQFRQRRDFALGGRFGEQLDRALAAAAARQLGQRVERPRGAAIALKQRHEGDRADIFAARKTQPVEAFAVAERAYVNHK